MATRTKAKPKTELEPAPDAEPEDFAVMVPIDSIFEDLANANVHDDADITGLMAKLATFGQVEPLVVQASTRKIIGGNGRLHAMRRLGWTECRVHLAAVDNVTATAMGIALNTRKSHFDEPTLAKHLRALQSEGFNLVATGFEDEEVDRMLERLGADMLVTPTEVAEDPGPQIDRAAEFQEKWQTEPGQLWVIPSKVTPGKEHRLLCGDSTKADDVTRVMGDKKADLCLTDPPYGVGEDYATHYDSKEGLDGIIEGFFPIARSAASVVLLTPGNGNQPRYPTPDWTLAWGCPAGIGKNSWGFTCWQPILAYGKDPYLAAGKGCRPDFLNATESADNSLGHPCPKPMGVWIWLIERGSPDVGQTIYDPFVGSVTTIVAAEQTGRLCRGIEIAPKYVAVILERLAGLGLEPALASV